jgi:putative tryptophan/tyrosine transport system substrate-binding protein
MRRREFITFLSGAAATWPFGARAQQPDRMRRIGVLMTTSETDAAAKANLMSFTQELMRLGWTDGANIRMDIRWANANVDRMQMFAKELVDLQPDVIFAHATPVTAAFQRQTRTIPIVFAIVSDPEGAGFVASLSRPGGNITGFINIEASMGAKWLELLTEIAPSVKRVAIMFNPDTAPGGGSYFRPSFEAAASSLKVETIAAPVHSDTEIDSVMASLRGEEKSGLVVMTDSFNLVHRATIISLAARDNIPAVYAETVYVKAGGLLSYGEDAGDIFRRAAPYVDRILRGTRPAELPVQLPINMEMAVNIKTAKALGLTVPQSILLRADVVIE